MEEIQISITLPRDEAMETIGLTAFVEQQYNVTNPELAIRE